MKPNMNSSVDPMLTSPARPLTARIYRMNRNNLAVFQSSGSLIIVDTGATVIARTGCNSISANQASCPDAGIGNLQIDVEHALDENDHVPWSDVVDVELLRGDRTCPR
jgi:hypothetical protein